MLLAEAITVDQCMKPEENHFPTDLLNQLKAWRSDSFTGAGIVFYSALKALPNAALGNPLTPKPQLPITGIDAIASTLSDISDSASPWHDGFHMVDIRSHTLTHLSQFLAPPLENLPYLPESRPSGARLMTAMITSMVDGIDCVGVLSTSGDVIIYKRGLNIAQAIKEHE